VVGRDTDQVKGDPMPAPSRFAHYQGWLATWYDTLSPPGGADVEFYRRPVLEARGKVLELGCGTGRLLVPFRQAGADISGVDAAPDMLAICRRKLEALGLTAPLFPQDMARLRTGERYALILAAGPVFQMLDDREDALSCLHAVRDHLEPGGRFLLDLEIPWADIRANQDGVWRQVRRTDNEDGDSLIVHECHGFDLREQLRTGSYRYELYRGDHLVETIAEDYRMRWYGRQEFVLLLEKTGFGEVRIEPVPRITSLGEATVYSAVRG
jgi:SAM-dependent methyltransferase